MSLLATVGAVVGLVANGAKAVPVVRGWLAARNQPQVELDIIVVGMPLATVGDRYTVHVQAFLRVRLRNHTGAEARLADPHLVWREVRPIGRRRILRSLRLWENTGQAMRQLEEIVPPYSDGLWLQDLYFQTDWQPDPVKLKGRQPTNYPQETELVLDTRIWVPHRAPILVAQWYRQLWNWPGQYGATWARQDRYTII
jgi:hypothetical protein